MHNSTYQVCTRCVMDTTDPGIEFDRSGRCNHCRRYDGLSATKINHVHSSMQDLLKLVDRIKSEGKGKDYDCIIGLSGGVDSSYAAYQARKLGLRLLAIHLDNGWDAEIAVRNIENIVKKLNIDLYTYVLDWEEFRDLQVSFLKASVIDVEALSDHAITAAVYRFAAERKIQYVLSGGNNATELIMPRSWVHRKSDLRNIMGIHRLYGTLKMVTFPTVSTLQRYLYYEGIKRIRVIKILNFIPYVKSKAIEEMERDLGWQYYGGKHFESVFTRFYQAYILPQKFNVDKRRAHLSTLICSGQITREQALDELRKDIYDPKMLKEDREFVLKKLGLSEQEFDAYIKAPGKSHLEYPSDQLWVNTLGKAHSLISRLTA